MTFKTSAFNCNTTNRWATKLKTLWASAILALASAAQISSAQVVVPQAYDPAFVQQILKRLEAQEKELKELRASRGVEAPAAASAQPDVFPKLSFHGFGDINYKWDNDKITPAPAVGQNHQNSFVLGQLDFFVTSQLANDLSILSETVIEADSANNFGIEVERLLLQWRASDYFNLDIGRYHSSVGYYNTAYHHGTWFQTAAGRPGFLDFEDGGGLIPAHNVGISVNGQIPSGKLGLRYIFEVGNGRPYHNPAVGNNPVLNVTDDNDYKAFNFVLLARPEGLTGLQLGAGVYFDRATPDGLPRTDELMVHGHAVYKSGPWEFLSEGYYVRHSQDGGSTATTPAFFGQLAHKFGVFTPYARFSYINASDNDAIWNLIGSNGLRYGPGFGLRWDFSTLAAFKVQYDFQKRRNLTDLSTLTLQACFTF